MKKWKIAAVILFLGGLFSLNFLVNRRIDEAYNVIAILCGITIWTGALMFWSVRPWVVVVSSLVFSGGLGGFFFFENFPLFRAQLLIIGVVICLYLLIAYAFEEKKE